MSRSNPTSESTKPVISKYISYSGQTGEFKYWDKETESNIETDKLEVTVLDTKISIKGYNVPKKAWISSNMINNINEELVVYSKANGGNSEVVTTGVYGDIKADIKAVNGKFTQNIICLVDLGKGLEVCNVQLSGTALGSLIEFTNENSLYENKITITKGKLSKMEAGKTVPVSAKEEKALNDKLAKNPRAPQPVWFYIPSMELGTELSVEEAENATEKDREVQAYFNAKSKPTKIDPVNIEVEAEVVEAESPNGGNEDLPF